MGKHTERLISKAKEIGACEDKRETEFPCLMCVMDLRAIEKEVAKILALRTKDEAIRRLDEAVKQPPHGIECDSVSPRIRYKCTLKAKHKGPHVGHGINDAVAAWDDEGNFKEY